MKRIETKEEYAKRADKKNSNNLAIACLIKEITTDIARDNGINSSLKFNIKVS